LDAPRRDRAVNVRPSTVTSAIQAQAELGVRVDSSIRHATAIGRQIDPGSSRSPLEGIAVNVQVAR
jgi:hypothetical protein